MGIKLNGINKPKKSNVNLTLDSELIVALKQFKENNNILYLSPLINEMLWDWLEQEQEKEKKEEDGN